MNARRQGVGVLLIAAALVFPSGASASLGHGFLGNFCEPSGIGAAPCEPSFKRATGMAVDQSNGNLLVVDMEAGTLRRFHEDGTPAPFSALGTNVIDGKGTLPCTPPSAECDGTPQNGLEFIIPPNIFQIAVDNSGTETDGNIYLTQFAAHVVDIFGPDGSFLGQLSGSSEGAFGQSCGVSVDPSGDVFVGELEPNEAVHKYEPSGPIPENADNTLNFTASRPCALAAGAGPTAGSVFVTGFKGPVWKFNGNTGANEGAGGEPIVPGKNVTVTVDPASGHLFVAAGDALDDTGSAVNEYDASGAEATLLSSIDPPLSVQGVAVNKENGNVYLSERKEPQIDVWGPAVHFPEPITGKAAPIGPTSATLNGTVNPDGVALDECFFEYDTAPYAEGGPAHGKTAPCEEPDAAEVGGGTSPVAVHAQISGLEKATTYHFRLAAANANNSPAEPNLGEDEDFLTLGASIKDESASQITANSATLGAQVNPNGEEATYRFEYVSNAQFKASGYAEAIVVPSPPGKAGSGSVFEEVAEQIGGLQPDSTYHFRIAVTTPATINVGPDQTFTTFVPKPTALPDDRAYEMVSPPQKIGEVFPPEPKVLWRGSCGNCLPGVVEGQMAMQAAEDGEAVAYEGSPFTGGLASGANEYLSRRSPSGWATQSLSTPIFAGAVEKQGYQAFSSDLSRAVIYQFEPALSEDAPLDKEGTSYANLYLRSEDGSLTPLVAKAPPKRDAGKLSSDAFLIGFAGANAGTQSVGPLHRVIFEANDALTKAVPASAPAAPAITAEKRNLYQWSDGKLALVNVAPGNATALAGTVFGSGRELGNSDSGADFDGAISNDGSRVFFSVKESGQVYVRIDGKETRKIEDPGKFLLGSADGTKVLLSNGCLYDLEAEECEADLTKGKGGFQGILGASKDLARIYFVDSAALTAPAEENASGEHAEDGKPNLYTWSEEEGTTKFIATLQPEDNAFADVQPRVGDWMPSSASRTAQVSPDGRFLAFMRSGNVLFGDECHKNAPADCSQVFEYRADSEELICVSCNPSGQKPLDGANLSLIYRDKDLNSLAGYPQPTNLSANDGRLFFESGDVLTLGDTNGRIADVYQWEPQGVGDCERPKGCVSLISSGQGPNDSMFLDATPSGDDAFFVTRDRLLPRDKDERLDLYLARVGGGIAEDNTPPCQGEACKGPSTVAPQSQSPGSASFAGPGDEKPKSRCKRGFTRKNGKCRKAAKHRHRQHKRAATHNRGASK